MAITRIGPNQSINLASNITGTLPTGNGGTGATSFAPGKVLQVQSSSITSTANGSTTSIVEFMNLSITPSSTSNKIFCLYQGTGYANDQTCLLYTSPSPRD